MRGRPRWASRSRPIARRRRSPRIFAARATSTSGTLDSDATSIVDCRRSVERARLRVALPATGSLQATARRSPRRSRPPRRTGRSGRPPASCGRRPTGPPGPIAATPAGQQAQSQQDRRLHQPGQAEARPGPSRSPQDRSPWPLLPRLVRSITVQCDVEISPGARCRSAGEARRARSGRAARS